MTLKINIEDVKFPQAPFDLLDRSILIGNRGSVAHGTYVSNTDPNSIDDIDLKSINALCMNILNLRFDRDILPK